MSQHGGGGATLPGWLESQFSRRAMEEHWRSGYDDARKTLSHPEVLQRPTDPSGVAVYDFLTPSRVERAKS